MIIYLLKANICLSIFLMIYWGFLRKNTFYHLNRIYFLWAMIGSMALPLLEVADFVNQHQEINEVKVIKYIPDLSFRADNQRITSYKTQINSIPTPKIYVNFRDIFQAVFLSGVVVLLCKLIVQIISIFRFLRISTLLIINQINIRNLLGDVSPFSFFNYIFINIHKHSEEDLSEIIAHESAHASQFHSLDVMLMELFCAVFWINPLAWMMRKFLKQNLEFLTDKAVIDYGFEARHYQYNLLKISGLNPISVSNNFNFSDLKLRIKMMNKKRSSKLHLLKYFLTIPLGAVLILAFNISKAKPFDVRKSVVENMKEMVESVEFENVIENPDNKKVLNENLGILKEEPVSNTLENTEKVKNIVPRNFMVEVLDKHTEKGIENAEIHVFGDTKIYKTNFSGIAIIDLKQMINSDYKYIVFDTLTIRTCPAYKFWVKYNNVESEPIVVNGSNHRITFYVENNKINPKKEEFESEAFKTELQTKFPITPKTKWFYCKEDIIKELERTQELSSEKRPLYKINGIIVANNYKWNDVSIYSILNLEYWSPEDGEKLVSQFGESVRNGIYNLNVLVKQTIAQRGDVELPFIKTEKNLPKIEKCTPSMDFPANALYVIDGKLADAGYLHKYVKPDEIDKLEVMEIELAKRKYGVKGKSGVILISTKKFNKLEEK